jgi:hypothetical protein
VIGPPGRSWSVTSCDWTLSPPLRQVATAFKRIQYKDVV